MTTLDDLFAELMKKPGFKEEYEALAPEFLPLINGTNSRKAPKKRTKYSQHKTPSIAVKYVPEKSAVADTSQKPSGEPQ